MATFSGRLPSATFGGLLNIDNANTGIDATLRTMQDGNGHASVVQFSTGAFNVLSGFSYNGSAISIDAAFTMSGAFAFTGTLTGITTVTFPTSGTLYGTATGSITSAQLKASLTDETGSGAAVFATSPTLVSPALGTPASGNLANCTGYTVSSVTEASLTNVAWTVWTPTVTGGPTGTAVCYYKVHGSVVFCYIQISGTSNATSFSVSNLPVTASGTLSDQYTAIGRYTDNGVDAGGGWASITSGSTTITFNKKDGSNWTASGTKSIYGMVFSYSK